MFYNKKKCHHLHVGNYTPVGNYTMMVDETPIEIKRVEHEKDLGIIVDNKLNFWEHITSKVNIANRNVPKSLQKYGQAPFRIWEPNLVTSI